MMQAAILRRPLTWMTLALMTTAALAGCMQEEERPEEATTGQGGNGDGAAQANETIQVRDITYACDVRFADAIDAPGSLECGQYSALPPEESPETRDPADWPGAIDVQGEPFRCVDWRTQGELSEDVEEAAIPEGICETYAYGDQPPVERGTNTEEIGAADGGVTGDAATGDDLTGGGEASGGEATGQGADTGVADDGQAPS